MAITKAIIPVAGWGTRRLPITKSIEKCMLPVGNRPVIDYVVQDCIAAGITDIYIVVSEGSTQVQSYYSRNEKLEKALLDAGKVEMMPLVMPPEGVNFHFVTQDVSQKYGTATPVALVAQELVLNESVLVLMGDDFIFNKDGSSETARLIAAADGGAAMMGAPIGKKDIGRYGVLEVGPGNALIRIVEKPSPEDAPSNLVNISKYIVTPELMARIVAYTEAEIEGEYQITTPITDWVKEGGRLNVMTVQGEYLDSGSVETWLSANKTVMES